MAQSVFPIDPVEVTPGTANAWTDVDVSAHIPAAATGVLLHLVATASEEVGLRKNGSTDDRYDIFDSNLHRWAAVGVASQIFEAYVGSTTTVDIYLVGYTMPGVTFFTNAYDKSVTEGASWNDRDCSAQATSATGLIFEMTTGWYEEFGLRKNGSSDDRRMRFYLHGWAVIGCDASQIAELYGRAATTLPYWLIGYITDGCTFNTNGTDLSLGSTGTWQDLAALPATSVMGFIEVWRAASDGETYGLRKNGSAEEIYLRPTNHAWGIVECDASQLIEGKISDTACDFFLVGYAVVIPEERSASVIIGAATTASRVYGGSRQSSTIIGALVSASRVYGRIRAAITSIGSLVSATRGLLTATRASSVISGILVSATRGLGTFTRTTSTIVGVVASATRVIAMTRASSTIVGIVATASRVFGRIRIAAVSVGNLVTATRGTLTATRASSTIVGTLVTATRIWGRIRISEVLVGIVSTATRGVATYTRTALKIIGVKVTAIKPKLALTRIASVLIGALVAAIVQTGVQRAIVYIGVKVAANRKMAVTFASTVAVGIIVTVIKRLAYIASAAVIVGIVSTTVIRMWGRIRASTVLVGAKVTATRKITLTIDTSSVIIGVAVTATRGALTVTRKAAIKVGILVSAFGLRIGRLLKMVVFGKSHRDMAVYTKPYYDMEVSDEL